MHLFTIYFNFKEKENELQLVCILKAIEQGGFK